MSQSTPTPNVNELFQQAADMGALSPDAQQALTVVDVGAQINDALGIPSQSIKASEVFLVGLLLDDSSSIAYAGNTQAVIDGYNDVLKALQDSKSSDAILLHSRALNKGMITSFATIETVSKIDAHTYVPHGITPLRDQICLVLGTMLAKWQEFANNGVPARTATLIMTDGHDEGSVRMSDTDVAAVVKDLLKSELNIIAAMGVDDGSTDFRRIFQSYGIPDQWILTPKNTQHEIRGAFQVFSQSAVRASQNAASFSNTALGGFGN